MALTADDVNYIVYRYLQESGFAHAAYTFRQEADVDSNELEPSSIVPGSLVHLLQRGLQYLELEANVTVANDLADTKFEVLHAADILQAQDVDKLKALVRERQDDATTTRGRQKFKPSECEDSGMVLTAGSHVFSARWSPAGDMLACYCDGDGNGGSASIWKVGTSYASTGGRGQAERVALSESGVTTPVVWRMDGRQLAVGKMKGEVELWDAEGQALKSIDAHSDDIVALEYSPNGSKLLTCGSDPTVHIWDSVTGTQLERVRSHSDTVSCISWRDEETFASSAFDQEVHLMSLVATAEGKLTAERMRTLVGHSDEVPMVKWAPNRWLLASCSEGTVKLWSIHQSTSLCELCDEAADGKAHCDRILSLAFRPAGPSSPNPTLQLLLATTCQDTSVKVWDCETGMLVHTFTEHTLPVHTCCWSPDGRTLATAGFDGMTYVWNLTDGQVERCFHTKGGVFDVCWSKDGRRLALGTRGGQAFVVDTLSGGDVRQQ